MSRQASGFTGISDYWALNSVMYGGRLDLWIRAPVSLTKSSEKLRPWCFKTASWCVVSTTSRRCEQRSFRSDGDVLASSSCQVAFNSTSERTSIRSLFSRRHCGVIDGIRERISRYHDGHRKNSRRSVATIRPSTSSLFALLKSANLAFWLETFNP